MQSEQDNNEWFWISGLFVDVAVGYAVWPNMSLLHTKILVIDDENALLEMLRNMLTRSGFVVDTAETAAEGIKKIHDTQYDLILTDIKMPGMSGNDLFEYVKTTLDRPIPVIAMSGTPWLTERSSFDAVMAKPFYKEELLNVVSQFVETA